MYLDFNLGQPEYYLCTKRYAIKNADWIIKAH